MTAPDAAIASSGAASAALSLAARLAREVANLRLAVGLKGMLLGAAALVLLLAGVTSAIVATMLSFQQTDLRQVHAASRQISEIREDLRDVEMGLLATLGIPGSQAPAGAAIWERATGRLRHLCASDPKAPVHRLADLGLACARFAEVSPVLRSLFLERGAWSRDALELAARKLDELVDRLHVGDALAGWLAVREYALLDRQQNLLLLVAGGTFGSLVAGVVLFSLVVGAAAQNRARWLDSERLAREAADARARLLEVIEAIPVGFGVYDRDERLMMYNRRLQEVNPDLFKPETIGTHIKEVIRRATEKRLQGFRDPDNGAAWAARQLERFRTGDRCDVQKLGDGRWLEFFEVRTRSGLTASVRVDVTDLKEREEALAAGEARYRQLVDSVVDVVFTADPAGRYTYLSAAVERIYGVKPAEMIGRSASACVHPDDHGRLVAALKRARHSPGQVQAVTLRAGLSMKAMRHLEIRFSATGEPDAQGRMPIAGVIRDVHRQTVLEQQRRNDMMKLRAIIESSGALILLVDRDLRAVLANRTFLDATGKTWDDVVYRQFEEVFDSKLDNAALGAWLADTSSGRTAPLEFDNTLALADGSHRLVRMTANPVRDEAGAVNHVLFIGVDETARRSAEIQLIDAARLATVGQMATGIAHEINQPLTVIQFAAEALTEELSDGVHRTDPDGFEADMRKRLGRLADQTQRAANIVHQLRIFARRPDEVSAPFDAAKAVRGAVDLVSEQMRLAQIEAEVDVAADLPYVVGHPNRLQQVLINLAVNARDAIAEQRRGLGDEAIKGWLGIRAWHQRDKDTVVIEVADSGPGIPADVLPRLFEPFFTTKPSGKGTGLGLSISSEIIREMNGTITAENRAEGGALFRITFPATSASVAAAA